LFSYILINRLDGWWKPWQLYIMSWLMNHQSSRAVLTHGHTGDPCQSWVSESLTCDEVGIVDLFHGLMDGENHDNYNELTGKPPAMSVRILNTWDLQTCFSNVPHFRGRIQWGGGGGGAHPTPPPLKLEIFWRKIVIFHTKYTNNFLAPLRSAQFF
jgi:hypothetical protein